MTIRATYEYMDTLTSLKSSKMANVLGVNALVFLGDGTLLLALRGKGATISKNMLTSSIAFGCFRENTDKSCCITTQELLFDYVHQGLIERLYLSEEILRCVRISISFLGLGRDVAWGGKPQLYYYVSLDMTAKQYLQYSKRISPKKILDEDREILLVSSLDLVNTTDYLKLCCINKKELLENGKMKYYKKLCRAECSFFNNCYHFSQYKKNEEFCNWLHYKIYS